MVDIILKRKEKTLMFRFDKEIKYFNPYYIDPFKYKSAFGHMSQVAWAKSDKLGCGIAHYNVSTNISINILHAPKPNVLESQM